MVQDIDTRKAASQIGGSQSASYSSSPTPEQCKISEQILIGLNNLHNEISEMNYDIGSLFEIPVIGCGGEVNCTKEPNYPLQEVLVKTKDSIDSAIERIISARKKLRSLDH